MSQGASRLPHDGGFRFVPELLVDYLNKSNQQANCAVQPASFFLHGVCLLISISGFTERFDEYFSEGKLSLMYLQSSTNGFLEKLVDIIYSFGGDIVNFSGDTIMCVFSADFVTNMSTTDIRKSMCGMESRVIEPVVQGRPLVAPISMVINTPSSISVDVVLRVMHCANKLTATQTDELSVHVAMSCGEMCFGILGGVENRWECLISGPCMQDLTTCIDDAPAQEAILSRNCAMVLFETLSNRSSPFRDVESCQQGNSTIFTAAGPYNFSLGKLRSGNFRIVTIELQRFCNALVPSEAVRFVSASQEEKLKQVDVFVPVPVAYRLLSSKIKGPHVPAEICEVTTMFMKWESYDVRSKHRDLIELQTCFHRAQSILLENGAYLRQFLVDNKGCVLVACWGVPQLSYLDNAQRALSAAALIKHELNKLDMTCSFGITTGDVYCGTVGSALRMEYAVVGSVVDLAARLMSKARGGILIDEATHSHLLTNMTKDLRRLGCMPAPGSEEPVQVYSYVVTEAAVLAAQKSAVEDHTVPTVCKTALFDVLHSVRSSPTATVPTTMKPKQVVEVKSSSSWLKFLTWPSTAAPAAVAATTTAAVFAPPSEGMPIVLIQGREKSVPSSVLTWLHAQAVTAAVPVCYIKLGKKSAHAEYGLWRKVLTQLMPPDFFEKIPQQRQHALHLLDRVFPRSPIRARTVGLSVMQAVLGVDYGFSVASPVRQTSIGGMLARAGSLLVRDGAGSPANIHSLKASSTSSKSSKSSKKSQDQATAGILLSIFSQLLKERATLIIIGNIEYADESSLQLLQGLSQVACQSAIVCSLQVPQQLRLKDALDTKQVGSLFAYHRAWEQCKATLQQGPRTSTITLQNYTSLEIDQMLGVVLRTDSVPFDVSQLVQDLSGGSYFWVREILQFIKEHGPEQFMSAVGDSASPASDVSLLNSAVDNLKSKLKPSASNVRALGRNKNHRKPSARTLPVTAHQVQLDKLVLCRYENLTMEMQRVLRAASIIGVEFPVDVLTALLPSCLRMVLKDTLVMLLNQKWLYQDTDNGYLYQFAHPHAHQIIYELTPSSERAQLHLLVADYIEETSGEDKTVYAVLGYHYQYCDTDKALLYCSKAVALVVHNADVIFDYGPCVDLLQGIEAHCRTAEQVGQLLQLTQQLKSAVSDCAQGCEHENRTYLHTAYMGLKVMFSTQRRSSSVVPINESSPPSSMRTAKGSIYSVHSTRSLLARDGSTRKEKTSSMLAAAATAMQSTESQNPERRARTLLLRRTGDLIALLKDKHTPQASASVHTSGASQRSQVTVPGL